MTLHTIHPFDLAEKRKEQSIVLIDVRTPAEFEEIHAVGAQSIPLDRLDPVAVRKEVGNQPIYLICKSGSRGKQACERFHALGDDNVINVEGGTSTWNSAGLPVQRGRKTISLERQVRIAAGSLVVLGCLLGAFVDRAFLGISGFVGAGLVFAGVTDTCGMAMLLAKMPWNQRATG